MTRQLVTIFFIIPLVSYGHFFSFSSCTNMRSNKWAPFLASLFTYFFISVLFMLLIFIPHASPLHLFESSLNFHCSFLTLCWCYHFFFIGMSFWCYYFVFVGVFTSDFTPLLLLHIILIAQNHNKPKLLLFQNFMKLLHLVTTISNFATTKEANA